MKLKIFATVLVIFFFTLGFYDSFAQTAPKIKVSLNKKSLNPGDRGVLTIKFKTAENVKIPKEPEIDVSVTGVTGTGLESYQGEGDYLNPEQVKYDFSVPDDAESGTTIKINGTVKYGYCNSETGICKKGSNNFSISLKVK